MLRPESSAKTLERHNGIIRHAVPRLRQEGQGWEFSLQIAAQSNMETPELADEKSLRTYVEVVILLAGLASSVLESAWLPRHTPHFARVA